MAESREVGVVLLPRNKVLRLPSRELRNNATVHENKLWNGFLKYSKPRFTRQRIIGNYIVDFFCHKAKLVIELDGLQHSEPEAAEYDKVRTNYLNALGITVMRFTNKEIEENMPSVCETIKKATANVLNQ